MLLSQGRLRQSILIFIIAFVLVSGIFLFKTELYKKLPVSEPSPTAKPTPLYKPKPESRPGFTDNFPGAANAKSPADLPEIPPWNKPPEPHVEEKTPLYIGFTRNWRLLQQVVVSYITAGWPPEDIYVVDNSGVMNSNKNRLLGLQNPFYLDYKRLTDVLGIKVLTTPTLLTFAQLQNFFTFASLENGWEHYFWAHMDSPAVSDEEYEEEGQPYKSLYLRAVIVMRETMRPDYGPLAARWFAYDRLTLVRTKAYVDVGGWDPQIPFYMTDCDMHERLWMRNFTLEGATAGLVYDVASAVDDLGIFYRRKSQTSKRDDAPPPPPPEPAAPRIKGDGRNSPEYHELLKKLDEMQRAKHEDKGGRNTWQSAQQGGQGEPFYRDSVGFEQGISMTMDFGRKVFEEKWGRGPCNLREAGLGEDDAWRLIPGWETEKVQRKVKEDREREREERLAQERAEKEKKKKEGNG
ncbi:MAG: hypothetical protein LQ343_004999 [Gyalolechia ehrenbergii]|nr:MAG: hypothetical protein LQ343_004999 [Gyalolechia ehrenbergii]